MARQSGFSSLNQLNARTLLAEDVTKAQGAEIGQMNACLAKCEVGIVK